MQKYRILLVVRHPVGGIRTFFRYVYRNFDPEKYRFTLIAPEVLETNALLKDLRALDFRYILTANDISNKKFFQTITKVIQNETFDLVHSHGFTSGVCSALGSILRQVPHITTCHDVFTEKQFTGFVGFIKKMGLSLALFMVNNIHCVSSDAKENLQSYLTILKFFESKFSVIQNGVESKQFLNAPERNFRKELGLSEDWFLIGFLGRFMSQKGFRYLVEAIERIKKKENLSRRPLVLCFDEGGFIREEKNDIASRGLTESFLFLPFVADVAPTLKGLDVVAMPSLWEACGLLAMEAMIAGVPLIGTDCVGLREVLKDTPATVIPVRDSSALAEALIEEMENPSKAKAENFAIEAATRFNVRERAVELEKLMLKYLEV
ncbi:MAG: glycosyltransferase family 4 protein [Candidatus Competibacteraceae bacterium]